MRPISGFSDCAARSRMDDALAPLLVASPGSGPPGSPNLSSRFSATALELAGKADLAAEHPTAEQVDAQHHDDQHERRAPGLVLQRFAGKERGLVDGQRQGLDRS